MICVSQHRVVKIEVYFAWHAPLLNRSPHHTVLLIIKTWSDLLPRVDKNRQETRHNFPRHGGNFPTCSTYGQPKLLGISEFRAFPWLERSKGARAAMSSTMDESVQGNLPIHQSMISFYVQQQDYVHIYVSLPARWQRLPPRPGSGRSQPKE